MSANLYVIEDYENETAFRPKKTNPNKANFRKAKINLKSLAKKSGHTLVVPGLIFLLESLFPWRYNHPCWWHKETENTKIADNILLFQRDNGGWPKNCDMQAILTNGQEIKLLQ